MSGPLNATRLNLRQVVFWAHGARDALGQSNIPVAQALQRLDETMPNSPSENYKAARNLLGAADQQIESLREQLGGLDQIIEALIAEL